jgi:hypothetical protein
MGTITSQGSAETTDRRKRRGHQYHADAHLLSGVLERPIMQSIPQQAQLSLLDWRGGHLYQRVQGYDLEGLLSFKSGYTRVSGYRSERKHAFVTIATSVIEGLNVFDVLTADRVVAQVTTSHPEPHGDDLGHVPNVTFLGTQFANLKISGYDVNLTVNPEICGERPANDVPYLFDEEFLNDVRTQADQIVQFADVPKGLKAQSIGLQKVYQDDLDEIQLLNKEIQFLKEKDNKNEKEYRVDDKPYKLNCSLVEEIILPKAIPGVTVVRNVMYVRDFGIVTLGNVAVGRKDERDKTDPKADPEMSNYFEINMFDLRLGCVGEGRITAASGSGNGIGKP